MVIDTFGFLAKALSFGAFDGVPITSSCPFQWNQMGTTLGVPSVHTYANRAGIFDCRSSFDTGCCKSSRPPCFPGIIPPVARLGRGSEIRDLVTKQRGFCAPSCKRSIRADRRRADRQNLTIWLLYSVSVGGWFGCQSAVLCVL